MNENVKVKEHIYTEQNALSDETCDFLLKGFHRQDWFRQTGATGSGVDKKNKASTDLSMPWALALEADEQFGLIRDTIINGFKKYAKKIDVLNEERIIIDPWYNIQWYKPNEGYFAWHKEYVCGDTESNARVCAWMFNLNTVKNGGGTEFKYCDTMLTPNKGQLSIFPSYYTHTHRGIVAPEEDKYIMTGWLIYVPNY